MFVWESLSLFFFACIVFCPDDVGIYFFFRDSFYRFSFHFNMSHVWIKWNALKAISLACKGGNKTALTHTRQQNTMEKKTTKKNTTHTEQTWSKTQFDLVITDKCILPTYRIQFENRLYGTQNATDYMKSILLAFEFPLRLCLHFDCVEAHTHSQSLFISCVSRSSLFFTRSPFHSASLFVYYSRSPKKRMYRRMFNPLRLLVNVV